MPLVIVCGIPGAGKTVVAKALVEWIASSSTLKTRYITESTVGRTRSIAYQGLLLVVASNRYILFL